MFDLPAIFRAARALEASDVHVRCGQVPRLQTFMLAGSPAWRWKLPSVSTSVCPS